MPVISLEKLDASGTHAATWRRLQAAAPGIVISAGQATSGKATLLLALVRHAQGRKRRVVLFTESSEQLRAFAPLPSRWSLVIVEPTATAWENALAAEADSDALLVILSLSRENARAMLRAARRPRWMFVTLETAFAGLDVSYVLRDMQIEYGDFADTVRWVWSMLLLPALCDACAEDVTLTPAEAALLGPGASLRTVRRERGCPACHQEGTQGRFAVLDTTVIDPGRREEIKAALVKGDGVTLAPADHCAAQDRAREALARGWIGLKTYREAIQRNPLLRAQHALRVAQVEHDKLARSLWLDLDVMTALAERTSTSMLVVEASGRVHFANALAREEIATPSGIAIVDDHLQARDPHVARSLTAALGHAVASAPRATRIPLATAGHGDGDLFVTPLPTTRGHGREVRRLALLFIGHRSAAAAVPPEDDLSQLFDLTPAEGKVASRLCAGLAPKHIARDLGVGVATIRSQVSSLLAKTGTTRQLELVRLLMSLRRG